MTPCLIVNHPRYRWLCSTLGDHVTSLVHAGLNDPADIRENCMNMVTTGLREHGPWRGLEPLVKETLVAVTQRYLGEALRHPAGGAGAELATCSRCGVPVWVGPGAAPCGLVICLPCGEAEWGSHD
jgi:hypothetical protein